eukprot:8178425-Karenia_brevis.AAC.1
MQSIDLRSDTESSVRAIQDKILSLRAAAGLKTRITNGKTRDSKSMGLVETSIRHWRGKLITLRMDVQAKYGRQLTPGHLLWSWVPRHAAWLITRFQTRADGTTPFFGAFGFSYNGE